MRVKIPKKWTAVVSQHLALRAAGIQKALLEYREDSRRLTPGEHRDLQSLPNKSWS
jgi:hypothetical protein